MSLTDTAFLDVLKNVFFPFLHSLSPEIFLFLAVAIGYSIGKVKLGPIQLGGVCGTLIIALIIGQAEIAVDPGVKSFFFAIFIFSLGYAGGPQFFANLNAKGLRLGILSIIEFAGVLILALTAMRIFGFDPGTVAGLVAGSATESAVIGTASDAIARLPLPVEAIKGLQANVVTAYSITYVFGLITIVVFTSQIAPLLLRANLRDTAEKLWASLGGSKTVQESGAAEATPEMVGRIYNITVGAGKTIAQVNALMGNTARVERVLRKGASLDISPSLTLRKQDLVLVMGHRSSIVQASAVLGTEEANPSALNMVVETEEYIYNGNAGLDKTLAEMAAAMHQQGLAAEVYLAAVLRGGNAMPLVPDLRLQAGDVLRLFGSQEGIRRIGARVGARVQKNDRTNFIYISIGIVLGILIGRITFPVGGIDLSLGTGGGALLTGLVFGWFQTRYTCIAPTPPSSLEIMKDLGLSTFVACVGLASGKQAMTLVLQYGFTLPLVGICISLIPAAVSLLVGHFLLKIELPILLGGIAGQQCSTPALSAVQASAGNTTPLIGYTITYAISNALLPLLGPVIVGIAAATQGM